MESSKAEAVPAVQRTGSEVTTQNGKDVAEDTALAPEWGTASLDPKVSEAKATLLIVSVLLSMFLVALDRTILSTAVPAITNEFASLPDIGWYASAYLLTCCAFQLQFGKIYRYFKVKPTFLISVLIFEVGSIVCGASPNSDAFIVGRAIAGLGAAGIFGGSILVIASVVPLHKRAKIQGLFGAIFGISSIVGPLIGGAFTTNVTWRWCFYLNVPIGAVAFLVILVFLNLPESETTKLPLKQKLLQLDIVGSALLIPGVVCLLLALQWGGQTYAWNDGRIIALLVLTGVLLVGFVVAQVLLPATALIPIRILKQRSILAGAWQTFCLGASMYIYIYFIPIWFQTIEGVSAVESGIRFLPLMLSMMFAAIVCGLTTANLLKGYYTPYAIVGTAIMTVGSGLITTFQVSTTEGQWIGYQIVYGFGMGMAFQQGNLAAQTVLPMSDVSIGIALMFFSQLLGGTIFVSVGENVFDSQLISRLAGVPGFSPDLVTSEGATALLASLPESSRPIALPLYNAALRQVFIMGLVLSALSVLGAGLLEWKSVNKDKKGAKVTEEKKSSEEAQSHGESTVAAEKTGEAKESV